MDGLLIFGVIALLPMTSALFIPTLPSKTEPGVLKFLNQTAKQIQPIRHQESQQKSPFNNHTSQNSYPPINHDLESKKPRQAEIEYSQLKHGLNENVGGALAHSRRSYDTKDMSKRFEIKQRVERKVNNDVPSMRDSSSLDSNTQTIELEDQRSIYSKQENPGADVMDALQLLFSRIPRKDNVVNRAAQALDIKPSFIRFKSSAQPTLKLEVSSESIVKALQTILANPAARRLAKDIAGKAVIMLRSLSEPPQPRKKAEYYVENDSMYRRKLVPNNSQ